MRVRRAPNRRAAAALGLVFASLLPAGADASATLVLDERVVIEADLNTLAPTRLRATMRARRFVTGRAGGYGLPIAGNLDEQSTTLELCTGALGCDGPRHLVCFAAAPVASMWADHRDAGSIESSGANCTVRLAFEAASDPFPFLADVSAAPQRGLEIGYRRALRASHATLDGEPIIVTTASIQRTRAVSAASAV